MEAWTLSSFFHSLFANSDFYHLLITFANRDQHNVGVSPDLGPNCLLRLSVGWRHTTTTATTTTATTTTTTATTTTKTTIPTATITTSTAAATAATTTTRTTAITSTADTITTLLQPLLQQQ